jgi:outer membrane protein assembly factor BamE
MISRHLAMPRAPRRPALLLLLAAMLTLSGCVYRIDVQQGNLLDEVDVQAVRPGMTRNQVRFLLGTPVVDDPFHLDRWDYMYYLRPGKSREARQRWLIVWFDGDTVREIQKDVPVGSNTAQAGSKGGESTGNGTPDGAG